MAFPTSPANGNIHKDFIYNSTIAAWTKMPAGIKESGSNGNGKYMWFISGMLIQWGNFNETTTLVKSNNGASSYEPYYDNVRIDFPIAFGSSDYGIHFSAGYSTSAYPFYGGYQTTTRSSSYANVAIMCNYPYGAVPIHCTYMVTGTK